MPGSDAPVGAVLEARGIVKRFGSLLANDHIDLAVTRGEVHAVMGENGAGKSTLMSILYGMQQPDAGEILLAGRAVHYRSALDAIAEGMGMVHQAFKLFTQVNILTQGGPRGTTDTVVHYMFTAGFVNQRLGLASAVAIILFFIVLIVSLVQRFVVRDRK